MFTISVKLLNDYFSFEFENPVTVHEIKNAILHNDRGKGFYYKNLLLVNYHTEILPDDKVITETTVLKLIIRPMVCTEHTCGYNHNHH